MARINLSKAFLDKYSNPEEVIEFNPKTCSATDFKEMITLLMMQINNDVNKRFIKVEKEITDLNLKVKDLEDAATLKETEFTEMSNRIKLLEEKMSTFQTDSNGLAKELDINRNRVVDLERYTRSFNLRFQNIPEAADENCIQLLQNTLNRINIPPIEIENAHRVGEKKENGKPRAIIARFSRRPERIVVLKKRRDFFNIGVPLYEDLCKQDLDEKKKHADKIQELYRNNAKVFFSRGHWFVNGKKYTG